jgi:hypothetical protein
MSSWTSPSKRTSSPPDFTWYQFLVLPLDDSCGLPIVGSARWEKAPINGERHRIGAPNQWWGRAISTRVLYFEPVMINLPVGELAIACGNLPQAGQAGFRCCRRNQTFPIEDKAAGKTKNLKRSRELEPLPSFS